MKLQLNQLVQPFQRGLPDSVNNQFSSTTWFYICLILFENLYVSVPTRMIIFEVIYTTPQITITTSIHPDISGFLPIIIPLKPARLWRRSTLTSSSTPDGWVLSVMLCSLDATSPCCLPGGYRHRNRDHPGKNCGFQRDFPVAVCFFEKIERVAF